MIKAYLDEEDYEEDDDLSKKLPPPWGIEQRRLFLQSDSGKNHGNYHSHRPEFAGYGSSSRNPFYRKV